MSGSPVLSARDLSVGYPGPRGRTVLSGMDADVAAGRLVCLIGPNGSGKSTLLNALGGLQAPLSGTIEIMGARTARMPARERARLVSMVLTDSSRPAWMSSFEVAALGRHPHTGLSGRLSERDKAIVMAALEEAGAAPFAARPFSELSDGERQKVLMARALAQECPLVLLDEPTVYLDAPSRREGLALLRRLTRDRGKTAIIALHEIDLALEWGDELWIASPKDGRLISGLPETLALSGSLSRAFGTDPSSAARDYAGNPSVLGVLFPFEEKSGERRSCALSGPEGAARYWISRLLRRKGYDVPETAGPGDLIVSYAPDESGRLRFSLRDGRAESSGEGLDGLDSLLGP